MANSKSKTKKVSVPKQYPTYENLLGQAAKIEDEETGDWVEGSVTVLGEHDDNGVPQTAVFQHRREVTQTVVNPKNVILLGGNGFEGGN
jgi:hypothetical protein